MSESFKNKLTLAIDTTSINTSCAITSGSDVIDSENRCQFLPKSLIENLDLLPSQHQKFLVGDIISILKKNKIKLHQIDSIAVSGKSGVKSCLSVGKIVADTISKLCEKSIFETDHILAHIYSCFIDRKFEDMKFPILVFSASGSHNEIALIENSKKCRILFDELPPLWKEDERDSIPLGIGNIFSRIKNQLGMADKKYGLRTMEAFERLMLEGDPHKFDFRKYYRGEILDLNFLDFLKKIFSFFDKNIKNKKDKKSVKDYAASFQESLTEILAEKIMYLAKKHKVKEVHVTGGISCNSHLEGKLKDKIKQSKNDIALRYPLEKCYKLDNAAMIGVLAHLEQKHKIKFIDYKPNIT